MNPIPRSLFSGRTAVLAMLALALNASAQSSWTNLAGGNWSVASNWTPAGVPPSSNTTIVNFNTAGTYASTNDVSSSIPFVLNQLNLGGPTLTLSGYSLQFAGANPQLNQNGAGNVTISNSVDFPTSTLLGGPGGGSLTFSSVLSGAGSLIRTNLGTLTLSVPSTFTGGLTVNGGTLVFASKSAFGTGTITLAGGVTVQKIIEEGNSAGLATTNAINLSGGSVNIPLAFGGVKDMWFSGPIAGSGGLKVSGDTRWLSLNGNNSFSGGVLYQDGTCRLVIGHTNALGTGVLRTEKKTLGAGTFEVTADVSAGSGVANPIDIAPSSFLNVSITSNLKLSGPITNTGSLYKAGTATLTLAGSNTFSGSTILSAGGLVVSNALALQNSTLNYTNGSVVFASGITAPVFGGLSGTSVLALTNADGTPVVLSVGNNNGSTTSSNMLSGSGSLTKVGTGTLTLATTNAYSGVTTVSGGILRLTNSVSVLSSNTDVVLTSGNGAINLGFTGTNWVNALFINGIKQGVGSYGANGSTVTGSGYLGVTSALASSRKDILGFAFPALGAATISGTNISISLLYGTAVTSLAPTVSISLLANVSPASGVPQDFTSPVNYTVTAQDGSTKIYRVTVTVAAASSAKDILSFTFPALGAATISGTNITMVVPFGAAVTNLAPAFTLSQFAAANPVSGTARDFTSPQTYTTTAQDNSTKTYKVTVSVTPASSAKDFLTFSFSPIGDAVIAGTNIVMTVPGGTIVANMAPTYTLSQFATASPASGATNNFTTPQLYTVTAQDGSTKRYLVTVQTYSAWSNSASFYVLTDAAGANLPGSAYESNFPLLLRLNSTFFDFSQAKAQGDDIRFSTPAGAMLRYQIEQWDAANGVASIWVRLPAIAGNARQEIKMYWGKADAVSESSGSAVFNSDNSYACVFHMNDALLDEVGNLVASDTGTTVGTGMIGKGRNFTLGTGIDCGENITNFPAGSAACSTEAWFRGNAVNAEIVDWGTQSGGNKVQLRLLSPPRVYVDGNFASITGTNLLALGQWYHVAHTYNGGSSASLYVNGQLDTSANVSMTFVNPSKMWMGGWYNSYSFAGDIDEVRVSRVARSANWFKLEYQNQNPLQTLAGPLVQPGSTFSVAPAAITMNEGTVTNLVGQAGGAQKVYWIYKQNGQETVLAVDQFALNFAASRVSGDQSFKLQFKAIYPTGVKTNDVPVTIKEYLPDPVFTLTAPSNWDGRQTITVTPSISNWSDLVAKGVTNLNYTWTVAGVAAARTITPGMLTLTRSQGSGPMTVTLVLNNGGALVTNSATIAVQEPATDAWVARTPATNEVPVTGQFFARDDTGYGTLYYNGTLTGSPTSVFLNVYSNGVLYTNISQSLMGGAYAFTARIAAGLVTYSVQFGSVTAGVTNILNSVTNLVCGDAFVIEGQSNAVANAPGSELQYASAIYTNYWIRSYGQQGGGTNGGWGYATRADAQPQLGYWGMDLASNLCAVYNVPICIINGAVGGTMINQHQPNPTNHFDTSATYSIYGNLLNRLTAARLTHGIRAVLWHQGEQDQGAGGPDGDYDYKFYQQYFVDMSAAWKQDYPNLRYYYFFQIYPNACGDDTANDMLREVQRTLPSLFSHMQIMSTIGVVPGSTCHYVPAGYQRFSDLISPLVQQDLYGLIPAAPISAPVLKQAYFTTTNRTEIALEFGQDMAWNSAAPGLFYFDYVDPSHTGVSGKVTSGSASGHVLKLQLSVASTNQTITYVAGGSWNGVQASLLYGSNGIAALTFCSVPIAAPAVTAVSPAITSLAPVTGRTNGGTVVTLTGSNFLSGATVQFGGSSATAVTVNSSTQLTATTPAHAAGLVNVIVANTNTLTATNQFTYVLPPPPATLGGTGLSGTNLMMVWSSATSPAPVLLMGTNITQPRSTWTPVQTNIVGPGGLSTNTIPVTNGVPQRYYRLSIPYN